MNRLTPRGMRVVPAAVLAALFLADAAVFPAGTARGQYGRPYPTGPRVPTPPQPGVPGGNPYGPRPPQPYPSPPQPYRSPYGQPYQQPQPPSYRSPPQTVWITVWSCSRCGAEVGRGDRMPDLAMCPRCGAHFQSVAPVSRRQAVPADQAQDWSDTILPVVLIVAGLCVAAFLVVVIVVRRRPQPAFAAAAPGGPTAGDAFATETTPATDGTWTSAPRW